MKKVASIIYKPSYSFTLQKRQLLDKNINLFEPLADLYAKKFRKQSLEATIMNRTKIVVPPKRIRRMEDKILNLKKNKECPVILGEREEFVDLDLVYDQSQIFALRRRQDPYTQSYFMDIDGEEIRFNLQEIYLHPIEKFIIYAKFQRYIVGRPNILEMPIMFKPTLNNIRMNRGADFELKMDNITVISYNNDYPTRLEIDPSNVTHTRGYKIGDLQNALPPGMFLHKRYSSSLNKNILTIGGDREKIVEQEIKKQQMMESVEKDGGMEEDQQQLLKTNAPKKVSNKKKKVRSLKKIVQGMAAEIKERLANIQ